MLCAEGVKGGIESAFMSTTFEREVAMHYASQPGKPALIFEIQMGMIDRGAELGWVSQYPHEAECLFAPLTGAALTRPLALHDGDAHLKRLDHSTQVSSVFGRYESLMSRLIQEVLSCVYIDYKDMVHAKRIALRKKKRRMKKSMAKGRGGPGAGGALKHGGKSGVGGGGGGMVGRKGGKGLVMGKPKAAQLQRSLARSAKRGPGHSLTFRPTDMDGGSESEGGMGMAAALSADSASPIRSLPHLK